MKILTDNETKTDLLNAEPIARSIQKLLDERVGEPITIGVHGDWGAGKSSILLMLAEGAEKKEGITPTIIYCSSAAACAMTELFRCSRRRK